jgi:hypothetical protein
MTVIPVGNRSQFAPSSLFAAGQHTGRLHSYRGVDRSSSMIHDLLEGDAVCLPWARLPNDWDVILVLGLNAWCLGVPPLTAFIDRSIVELESHGKYFSLPPNFFFRLFWPERASLLLFLLRQSTENHSCP